MIAVRFGRVGLLVLVTLALCEVNAPLASNREVRKSFGTVTGAVYDNQNRPLAGALITFLRDGVEEVVKQTKSGADGTFSLKVAPGRYLLRAAAEGFNAATFASVQVTPSSELIYRFNLEPIGQGRTVPERRRDRNDRKWDLRAAQSQRSVFQLDEGEDEISIAANDNATDDVNFGELEIGETPHSRASTRGVVEAYSFYSASSGANQANTPGLNFALATPVNENLDIIFAGQLGPFERLETTAQFNLNSRHRVNATVGSMRLPIGGSSGRSENSLGQISVRAVDEWLVRDGVVVVLGLDYSRFVGAGSSSGGGGADAFSPRFGVQFDMNARTRIKAAYAPGESTRLQSTAAFENGAVIFKEQLDRPIAFVDGQAVMERSRRLEFGVERVIDDKSSVEATAFFDTTEGRGVGLLSAPLNAFSNENGAALVDIANQQGAARGMRVVYMRRISRHLKASAGYSFGRGQQLTIEKAQAGPDQIFQNAFFHTGAAQIDADVLEGTRVRTVLRFSPRASVFAIDPFAGRLAVYDPSLSVLITQELPNFGLPVRAEAVLDARNILDVVTSADDSERSISLNMMRRMVRGGISVRF